MLNFGNRRLVERKLKEKSRSDRARIQIGKISSFGLLEMSRQRLRESAVKWNITLTNESFALKLLKTVELKSIINKSKHVKVNVCGKINNFIKQNFTEDIKYFENKNKIKIEFVDDNTLIIPDHKIEFQNKSKKTIEKIESLSKLESFPTLENNFENRKIKQKNNKFKKKKFYKKNSTKKKLNDTFRRRRRRTIYGFTNSTCQIRLSTSYDCMLHGYSHLKWFFGFSYSCIN